MFPFTSPVSLFIPSCPIRAPQQASILRLKSPATKLLPMESPKFADLKLPGAISVELKKNRGDFRNLICDVFGIMRAERNQ